MRLSEFIRNRPGLALNLCVYIISMGLVFIPVLFIYLSGQTPQFSLAIRLRAFAQWTTALIIHFMLPYLLRLNARRSLFFGFLDIHLAFYIIAAIFLINQPMIVVDAPDSRPLLLIIWGIILTLHVALTTIWLNRTPQPPLEKRKNDADLVVEDEDESFHHLEESYEPSTARKRR